MSVHTTRLVMFGLKMSYEEAASRFGFKKDEDGDTEEGLFNLDVPELSYKITTDIYNLPLIQVSSAEGAGYFVLGRVIDYGQDSEGSELGFNFIGEKMPITDEDAAETVEALVALGFDDLDNLAYRIGFMVFTHYT